LNDSTLIPLLVLLPLLGGLALAVLPGTRPDHFRVFALLNALITLGISVVAATRFDWTASDYAMQMTSGAAWIEPFGLTFGFGVDAISMWLVLLTTMLMPLVICMA
jgi:NADH-quinone oxidoreductase subunit M